MTTSAVYRDQVMHEIDAVPDEYLPYVLQLMQTLRESITHKSVTASFTQGWWEAQQGDIAPIKDLWEGLGGACHGLCCRTASTATCPASEVNNVRKPVISCTSVY